MSQYLFDNAAPQAAGRLGHLAALHDAATVRYLTALSVADGWHCLEIGGGGGSIAGWLARRVGDSGHVLVTDIDPRHLETLASLGLANVEVRHHDIMRDPLPPDAFDLIHARLVFIHLPTASETLGQVVAALKPGGCLLVEDYDPSFVDRSFPIADAHAAAVFRAAYGAVNALLRQHGSPPGWGHELSQRLRAVGLDDVGMEAYLALCAGSSERARLDRANFEQVRAEALERGLVTAAEMDEALALLDDPAFVFSAPIMFSAWGRRPAG